MATASKSGYRGMSPYMIGKNDRAGRLVPDEVKYADFPNALYWQFEAAVLKGYLIGKMSGNYNEWVEETIPDEATYMEVVSIMDRKLREISTCQHQFVEQTSGTIRLVAGEIDDGQETKVFCSKCGAVMVEKRVEISDEIPF